MDYKVRQKWDYKVWRWIRKCGNSGLQSVLGVGLQSVAK